MIIQKFEQITHKCLRTSAEQSDAFNTIIQGDVKAIIQNSVSRFYKKKAKF